MRGPGGLARAPTPLRRGGPGAAVGPGEFFMCRCSEMHSPAFSEQLMEHYFHCKYI